jgi:hypothetical protein
MAIRAWNLLSNGMGAVDWAGMPAVLAMLDVPDADIELLLHGLDVIKRHKPANAKD